MRFSIRDLLWLTLVAAFAVAWWVDRSRLQTRLETVETQQRAEAELALAEAKLMEGQARAAVAAAQANVEYSKLMSEAQDLRTNEGPVQGYKLLGPPPADFKSK